jgi:hypothetical protein
MWAPTVSRHFTTALGLSPKEFLTLRKPQIL